VPEHVAVLTWCNRTGSKPCILRTAPVIYRLFGAEAAIFISVTIARAFKHELSAAPLRLCRVTSIVTSSLYTFLHSAFYRKLSTKIATPRITGLALGGGLIEL
jgi:hypothetical protein